MEELATIDNTQTPDDPLVFYCSLTSETQAERLAIYDAVSNSESIDAVMDVPIAVTDVLIQAVNIADSQTGELKRANRVVLICEDGKAYGTVSSGVETALKNLFCIVGRPTWTPALKLIPTKKKGRKGFSFTTLALAD